jgi:acyl carrier protein
MPSANARLAVILASFTGLPVECIVPEASLTHDLQCDSLDMFEATMEIEDHFDLDIPDEDVPKWKTVADIQSYLAARGVK